MVAAALKTATDIAFPISNNASENGNATVKGVYSSTIVTTLDWLVLPEFSEIKYVHAYTTATGVDAEAYIDTVDTTKVFVVITGAMTILVEGTPA